jgi:hypothetical protein
MRFFKISNKNYYPLIDMPYNVKGEASVLEQKPAAAALSAAPHQQSPREYIKYVHHTKLSHYH